MRLVAVVFTREEQNYLLELLRAELEERDEPLVADLLQMLENPIDSGLVSSLERELRA
jgi:hypothetical protein